MKIEKLIKSDLQEFYSYFKAKPNRNFYPINYLCRLSGGNNAITVSGDKKKKQL
jgi:hypothetical protein